MLSFFVGVSFVTATKPRLDGHFELFMLGHMLFSRFFQG